MTCSNNSCSGIWGSCNRCSSCGCNNNGCSGSCGCSNSCGCSSSNRSGWNCSNCTARTGCGCGCNNNSSCNCGCSGSCGGCSNGCSGSCGCNGSCSGSCGCNNGCSNDCGNSCGNGCGSGCNGNCTYTQLHVTIPASGVCKVCCSGIAINSVNTALISGRYVTSVSYTATMDYIDRCGCRRTATTTQTTQVYLPAACGRFNNVCARIVRRTAVNNCCGAGICAVLEVCCR